MKKNRIQVVLILIGLFIFPTRSASQESPDGIQRVTVGQLKAMLANHEPVLVIDVRGSDYDSSDSKIKGAMRIVPSELESRLERIPRGKPIVTYCACPTEGGALRAARLLLQHRFKASVLKGGWNAWREANGPAEKK